MKLDTLNSPAVLMTGRHPDAVGIQITIEVSASMGFAMFGQQFIHGVDDFSPAGVIKSRLRTRRSLFA